MPRVRSRDLAGAQVAHAEPGRDEHVLAVVRADLLVHRAEGLGRAGPAEHIVLHKDLGDHHEQRRGHALARDVRHHQAQVIVIDQEEVIEIAADLLGRVHGGVDIEFVAVREGREDAGQHVRLDARGQRQLGADALLLGRDAHDLGDVVARAGGEGGEGLRQDLDLVPGAVGVLHLKGRVPVLQGIDPRGHALEGFDHAAGKEQRRSDGQQQDARRGRDQQLHRVLRALPVGAERL